jgi:hypothetical protein
MTLMTTTDGKIMVVKCLHHGGVVVAQGLDVCFQHGHFAFHLLDFHLTLMELLVLLQKLGLVSGL